MTNFHLIYGHIFYLLQFWSLGVHHVTLSGKVPEPKGLYSDADDVVILTHNNFESFVYGVSNVWLIEFYNSWCGHCIRYAPEYKKMASDLKGWKKVIRVGAIDCAVSENRDLCQSFSIKGYPSLKVMKPMSAVNDTGDQCENRDYDTVLEFCTKYVSNPVIGQKSWPDLQPLRSVEHIWNDHSPSHKLVALVFEEEPSLIGRQVILDMSGYEQVLIRRALKPLMRKFGIKVYPSLYLIHQEGIYQQLAEGENSREAFTRALLDELGVKDDSGMKERINSPNKDDNVVEMAQIQSQQQKLKPRKSAVYMQDLESTLTYVLRHEVAVHRNMDQEAFSALKNFTCVLAKYFPGESEVKSFLKAVHSWLSGYQGELTGMHWLHTIDDLQKVDRYLPDTVQWEACQGSQKQFRGYPCGLWTLFHTLTVSEYQANKDKPEVSPQETLNAIAGYMKHFFGCEECSQNFLQMAATIKTDVLAQGDQVLWLWKAHNSANKRLHGDPSEDPAFPKIQFPDQAQTCPLCHSLSSTDNKPVWNFNEVLSFLCKFYGVKNIVAIPEETEIIYQDKTKNQEVGMGGFDWWELKQRQKDLEKLRALKKNKRKTRKEYKLKTITEKLAISFEEKKMENEKFYLRSLQFNQIDIGMCVFFYLMCTIIVLLLYYHFSVRKLQNSCKIH